MVNINLMLFSLIQAAAQPRVLLCLGTETEAKDKLGWRRPVDIAKHMARRWSEEGKKGFVDQAPSLFFFHLSWEAFGGLLVHYLSLLTATQENS